jgi:cytoskeletal protein CcmA (bactofilin family)
VKEEKKMRVRMWRPLVVIVTLALVLAVPVGAASVVSDKDYVLAAGQTQQGNLYAFGDNVRIEGTVDGDLVAAGSIIEIAKGGVVRGDLMAAGQGVTVNGTVEGDVRAAGFTIQVGEGGKVGGELVAAGFSIGAGKGSTIGDDYRAAGYQGLLDGTIEGNAQFAGSALEINGRVAGNVSAEVDAPAAGGAPPMSAFPMIRVQPPRTASPGLAVAPDAKIDGTLTYASPSEATIPTGVVAGSAKFTQRMTEAKDEGAKEAEKAEAPRVPGLSWLINLVKTFVAFALFGLLLLLVVPRAVALGTDFLARRPLPALGWGVGTSAVALLLLGLVPVVTIALLALIGLLHIGPLGKPVIASSLLIAALLTLGLYVLTWVGRVVVSRCMGTYLLGRFAPAAVGRRYVPFLLGVLVYAVLATLPLIGFVLKLAMIFFGLGAVVAEGWRAWQDMRRGGESTVAPAV